MKLKIPSKTVTACDLCKRETSILTKCLICGKEYCMTCEAIICGCIHQPDICKRCGGNEKARKVVDNFVKPLTAVLKQRDAALKRIKPAKE